MELVLHLALLSDVGVVRERNEDAVALDGWAMQSQTALPLQLTVLVREVRRLGVCDGMGGHRGGADASRFAAQHITEPTVNDVPAAIRQTSLDLVSAGRQDPGVFGMGTTCVVLEVRPDGRATVFHVGDSRAYVIDPDLAPLTRDDRTHPDAPVLAQALGGPLPVTLDVHRHELELTAGQRLLLCSDGLVDMVPEPEIERLLGDPDPVPALVAAARAAGGLDNISVVLVEVVSSPLAKLAASQVEL